MSNSYFKFTLQDILLITSFTISFTNLVTNFSKKFVDFLTKALLKLNSKNFK